MYNNVVATMPHNKILNLFLVTMSMVSLVPMVPLSDDDVTNMLAAARWPLKARAVAIEFRAVFDNDNVFCGCPRASKVMKRDAAATTIYNWMATNTSITSASDADRFDALVTDFSALARVHTLRLHFLPLVTDVGIAALAHVHTLDVHNCGCGDVSRAPLAAQ